MVYRLLPVNDSNIQAAPVSSLSLRPGERVMWSGEATSRKAWAWAAAQALAGAVTLWWSNPVGVLLLVFALQSFWRSGVQVLIGGEAVRIRRTPLGRKGTVIPLSQVEAA